MEKPKRILMKLNLSKKNHPTDGLRPITDSDVDELSEVMIDAYQGTIDYSGESREEARIEIGETLRGKYGKIIENASLVIQTDNKVVSAIIFSWFEKEKMPLLAFTMTRASYKGKGYAKKLINAGLSVLANSGYAQCCLIVTEGNEPAISIYKSLGFMISL